MHKREVFKTILFLFAATTALFISAHTTNAARIDELRSNISDKNSQIAEIEREIAEYRKQLEEVGAERQSLESAIRALDLNRRKLLSDIRLTQNQIDNAVLNIERVSIEIDDKEIKIRNNMRAIAETLRRINEADGQSLIETLIVHEKLSEYWDETERLQQLQVGIRDNLELLRGLKEDLIENKDELEDRRRDLSAFRNDLSGQKAVVEQNKKQKDSLLSETKNKEANYQAIIAEKEARKEAFEEEVRQFEAQIRITIDPSALPPTGEGVLAWPVDKVRITQYFGNTPFASANAYVYNGRGHNGIDFGVPTGTKIKSALSGTVVGIGDTDQVCRNASYGKWILVRHNNGLSTLYAHLSYISVQNGQTVTTGETIGFSGNTGYSTGPHLHFTVYASQGVKIDSLKSRVCSGSYTIPLADLKAYLNPLSYL